MAAGGCVMSTPTSNDSDFQAATMYAPPWVRDGARDETRETSHEDLRDASAAAADNALAASEQFRRVLPPAAQLGERRTRWREPAPFDGDLAVMRLREKSTLDPVTMPL